MAKFRRPALRYRANQKKTKPGAMDDDAIKRQKEANKRKKEQLEKAGKRSKKGKK